MKQCINLIVMLFLVSQATAQEISELQTINGKCHIELYNPAGISFKVLSIKNQRTGLYAKIKQSVVSRLQNKDAIEVVTVDSTDNVSFEISDKDSLYCVLDDTLSLKALGLRYRSPVSKRFMEDQRLNPDRECVPLSDESMVRIDSLKICDLQSYKGRSLPSLGKRNNWKDAFAIRDGVLGVNFDGRVHNCISFSTEDRWLRDSACNKTIKTDSVGRFYLLALPLGCDSSFKKRRAAFTFNNVFDVNDEVFLSDDSLFKPGYQKNTLVLGFVSIESISVLPFNLKVSTNNILLQISYTLPAELSPAKTSLQISNTEGKTIQTIALEAAEGTLQVLLTETMPNGTYFCSVVSGGVVYKTERFVVKR